MTQLKQRFKVTHPFHPRCGKEYALLNYRRSWGTEYIEFVDEQGDAASIPLVWTDAAGIDPSVEIAQGRSAFRVTDLLRLCELVKDLSA